MPYGIDKNLGGDNPSNVSYVETCVKDMMGKGYPKNKAIATCKVIHKKHMEKKQREQDKE